MNQKYEQFKENKNLRHIARDEIVLDCDDKAYGDVALRQLAMLLSAVGYKLEFYKAEGQKSYHVHIKDIPHIAELPKEQNKLYKELLIKKYLDKLKEILQTQELDYSYLDKVDFTLCIPDHLVAGEHQPHFKYKTIKQHIITINQNLQNFCDKDIYEQATAQTTSEYKPQITGTGITAQITAKINIIDIAKQFGLDVQGNKCFCPFHADGKTPSLVFSASRGLFLCYGCQAKGNIILFYAMLKQLNPNFKYKQIRDQTLENEVNRN